MGGVPYRVPHTEPPGVPRQLVLLLRALPRRVRLVTIITIIMLHCANNRSVLLTLTACCLGSWSWMGEEEWVGGEERAGEGSRSSVGVKSISGAEL